MLVMLDDPRRVAYTRIGDTGTPKLMYDPLIDT